MPSLDCRVGQPSRGKNFLPTFQVTNIVVCTSAPNYVETWMENRTGSASWIYIHGCLLLLTVEDITLNSLRRFREIWKGLKYGFNSGFVFYQWGRALRFTLLLLIWPSLGHFHNLISRSGNRCRILQPFLQLRLLSLNFLKTLQKEPWSPLIESWCWQTFWWMKVW